MANSLAYIAQKSPPQLDDSWRSWIAENLMLGGQPADLAKILVERGFPLTC